METKNLMLPSLSKRKCIGLSLLNRVPETSLESKMYDIRKNYAKFREETRIEEAKIWDELYQNHRDLRNSFVSKYSLGDVMTSRVSAFLPRVNSVDRELTELPFAEAYKQFVLFKAHAMMHMRLRRVEKRPRYSTFYAKQHYNKNKNQSSFEKILHKYAIKGNTDKSVLAALNSENNSDNSVSNITDQEHTLNTPNLHINNINRSRTQENIQTRQLSGVMKLPRLATIANVPNVL